MSDEEKIIKVIVKQMRTIIGPIAQAQANKIEGLKVNDKVVIKKNKKKMVSTLVAHYKSLMGPVVITLAKKAIQEMVTKNPKLKIPKELR